jgi:hypothetical protein
MPGTLVTQVNSAADEKGFHFDFNPNGVLHPYLGIFRGRENSGLDTARVFTYWQLEPNADVKAERVLNYAKADPAGKQDPAITVHTVDQGRVVWISTTADDAWTSFPAKINYVALMHELLAGSVNVGDRWMNLTVGQSLEIPTGVKLTGAPSLTDPAQRPITLDPITSPDGHSVYRSRPLEQPGVYWLSTGSTNLPIVVNMAPEEADVRTLDDTAIRQALGEINVELHADQLPPLDETATAGHDFGWTVMVLVLAFVGVECVMAMRFSHQRRG